MSPPTAPDCRVNAAINAAIFLNFGNPSGIKVTVEVRNFTFIEAICDKFFVLLDRTRRIPPPIFANA